MNCLKLAAALLLGTVVTLWAPAAQALTCTVSSATMNFGLVNVLSGSPTDVQVTFTVTCTRPSGGGGGRAAVCMNLNAGTGGAGAGFSPRYLAQGASSLKYQIYLDAARTQIWGSAASPTPGFITFNVPNGNTRTGTITAYGRVATGQPSALSGLYVSSLGAGQSQVVFGDGNSPSDCNTLGSPVPLQVQATVNKTCALSATDLNFGAASSLLGGVNGQSSLQVNCGAGVDYSLRMSAGNGAAATVALRKMSPVAGPDVVKYSLYRDAARMQVWGDGTLGTVVSTGSGSGSPQSIAVYGAILPQPTPSAGDYEDTVVATIEF